MKTIVILGSSGFVGSHIAIALGWDFEIVGISRSAGLYTQIQADLTDLGAWEKLPKSASVIINAAAIVGRKQDVSVREYVLANAYIPLMASRYAEKIGARLIHLSTTGIYGFQDDPATERTSPNPRDIYNISKYQGEIACQSVVPLESLTILRICFPFGPGQKHGLVPTLLKRLRLGEPIILNTPDGKPKITPLFIEDCCTAIRMVLEKGINGVFNCAGNEEISIYEMSVILGEEMNIIPSFTIEKSLCQNLSVDSSNFRKMSGWEPSFSLKKGIRETIKDFKERE